MQYRELNELHLNYKAGGFFFNKRVQKNDQNGGTDVNTTKIRL